MFLVHVFEFNTNTYASKNHREFEMHFPADFMYNITPTLFLGCYFGGVGSIVENTIEMSQNPVLTERNCIAYRVFWRKIKGQHDEGQQDRESPRGKSSSQRVSKRTSEDL